MAKNAQHRHSKVGAFDIINVTILSLLAFVCVYPFYYLIIYSLSNSTEATRHGIWLLPVGFTIKNYKTLFQRGDIWMATFISASRAVIGTIVHVACSSFFASSIFQTHHLFCIFQKSFYLYHAFQGWPFPKRCG